MTDLGLRMACLAGWSLLPLMALQGLAVRRRTPLLPVAAGPASGSTGPGTTGLRLLVLGESTVAGIGATTQQEALTGQLAAALASRLGRSVQWESVGQSGVTAAQARQHLVDRVQGRSPDAIVLALGVNDVLRMRSPAAWSRDLSQLITELRLRLGPVPVFLASVPPLSRFPGLPQPLRGVLGLRATLLDRQSERLAQREKDVTHLAVPLSGPGDFFCVDRFHPSPLGYAHWAGALADAMLPRLNLATG